MQQPNGNTRPAHIRRRADEPDERGEIEPHVRVRVQEVLLAGGVDREVPVLVRSIMGALSAFAQVSAEGFAEGELPRLHECDPKVAKLVAENLATPDAPMGSG